LGGLDFQHSGTQLGHAIPPRPGMDSDGVGIDLWYASRGHLGPILPQRRGIIHSIEGS